MIALLAKMHQKRQSSTRTLAFVLFSEHLWQPSCSNFFVVEMLHNNFMHQQMSNLRKFRMNFIKSETPVCPDVLINPVFQVLRDEGQAPESLIVNACPALVKHSTSLSHIFLIHNTFLIHCNKLMVNFNQTDTFCIQKPNYSSHFTIGGILYFLTHFYILQKSKNDRISASFTWLVIKELLRSVNFEMVQFVDLCKCYMQMVFTFWMTLVH
jgi:hypothetical protein